MAKSLKKSRDLREYSGRFVAMFRDTNRWFHALMWFENLNGQPHCIHFLFVDSNGRVKYGISTMDEYRHILEPKCCHTTAQEYEKYLRDRLSQYGGDSGSYEILGVDRPAQPVEVAPERAEAHGDMYARAARALGVPEKELRDKYKHLNPGLQMMNLRNRMRAKGMTL